MIKSTIRLTNSMRSEIPFIVRFRIFQSKFSQNERSLISRLKSHQLTEENNCTVLPNLNELKAA